MGEGQYRRQGRINRLASVKVGKGLSVGGESVGHTTSLQGPGATEGSNWLTSYKAH